MPTFKQDELKTYTEDQIAKLRAQILNGRETESAAQPSIPVPRPNQDLLTDGGISLKRRAKVEYTPAGYTLEQHKIELRKILGCSISPQVG